MKSSIELCLIQMQPKKEQCRQCSAPMPTM